MPRSDKAFAVLLLGLSAGSAAAEPAVIESKLNLRAGPGPAFAVIAIMPPGARVEVKRCREDWCRVVFQRVVGYASRAYLDGRAAQSSYAAAGPLPAPPPDAAESEEAEEQPRIWRWTDAHWRDRHWRDIEFRNRHRRR
jgi:uncharacterized protein YraI